MSDIDALADTVRDTLPPRGVTSIPVKRTKSAVANAAHDALSQLVAIAKAHGEAVERAERAERERDELQDRALDDLASATRQEG